MDVNEVGEVGESQLRVTMFISISKQKNEPSDSQIQLHRRPLLKSNNSPIPPPL